MKVDTTRAVATYFIAELVLVGANHGLVLYEFALDDLVKGALIGAATAAYTFVVAQEIAKQTSSASQKAFDQGLGTPTPNTTTTVTSEGPPATSTTNWSATGSSTSRSAMTRWLSTIVTARMSASPLTHHDHSPRPPRIRAQARICPTTIRQQDVREEKLR